MILNELFKKAKKMIAEGGNLELPNPQDPTQPHQAQDIELKIHNRSYMVGILDQLMNDINNTFAAKYKKSLWSPELLTNRTFLSGSSLHFFDVKNIPDEVFVAKKPKVGDIDTQVDVTQEPQVGEFLKSMQGKRIGNSTFIGFKPGNNQFSSLWALDEPPVKIQIDFEFGRYDPETQAPDEWYAYSHSSAWEDVEVGIKGVFHKYINRALTGVSATEKYVARVMKKGVKISPEPVTDNDLSFAVSGGQGGGMSRKYKPYVDPSTGEPQVINGIPVMQLLDPKDRDYVQNLSQQFELIYGRKPSAEDRKLMNSFVGTIQLANKYLDDQGRESVANDFISICFEPGSQMINKDDPARDREVKFAAIDFMLENMKLTNAAATRKHAIEMSKAYEDAYRAKVAGKAPAAPAPLAEAEVKAQLRKGMPHLRDLKPNDLLDLIDEIHDGNGQFKLENIPLNVKVDGFGGRFGKSADGRPFMGTSNTPPRYEAGFVKYHQAKGTTDPEVLARSQLFDNLFEEMMKAIKLVDSKLGPDFLVNKQVTCEVLYLPFATETPEGKLKFVGIHYDKLPEGVQLALVPFRVVDATSGEDLPNANQVVKELTSIGQAGSVMFIDNSLLQNEALDVTAIVPPVENIEQIKSMLASGKLAQKREAKELLAPVALALEKAIINDPNIIGKDMLGKDYEGIVLNTRLGPVKVTSQEQRKVISDKLAAKAAARAEQPRESTNKTAVVAIGSFVGHIGHEQLWDYTVKKAAAVGGDPYLFIGNAQGKDDPIPPSVKVQTWHKLYPENAKNISTVTQEGGSLLQKIKHELINPLPGKPPRYDNIIIMVGEDQAGLTMPQALMKAVNKFPGYEHVKVSLEPTPRETGMSFTKLRNILKNVNATPEQQYDEWAKGFDAAKLGKDWILHLMDITRNGMGIQQPQAPVPQGMNEDVGGNYFYHATGADGLKGMLSSGSIRSAAGPQKATQAQTKLPTVSVTRDWGYASGAQAQSQLGGIGRDAILVLDRNAVESNFKTLGTSQSGHIGGLAFNPYLKKDGEARSQNTDPMARANAKAKAKYAEPTAKAGGEFEEAVVVPKGALPLKGTMFGFWVNPKSELMNDPTIMNDPRRLELAPGGAGRFVKATKPPVQQPPVAPVAETRLLNALIRPGQVMEGTSIESTMRAIINDIGEPITNVYDTMKFQAKKYVENHGELGRGFRMVAAGVGGRWVQNMYSDKLKNELYDLCRYNPRRTAELQDFLRGVESKGELDTKRSFGSIANGLPEILAKVGQYLNAPQLTKNAQRWIQNKQAYEQYIDQLEAEANADDYDEPAQVKPPKSTAVGQQNVQVDQIVNNVLSKLPSKVQGDIRNAIARAPNKLQALQAELQNRGVKAPIAEAAGEICKHCQVDPCICDDSHGFVNEERTSAAVKMQRAADRQRAKSDASLRRTPSSIPKPEPKKDEKVAEEGGVGVIASKKQAKDPRYSMSLTKDVRPGQVEKNLKAFSLAEKVAVEPDPTGYQKDLLTSPKNALVIDTPGDLDWYKLGQHYPTLGTDDPHEYGQGDSDMVIVPYDEKELVGLKQKLDRLKMRYKDIGGGYEQPEIHDKVEEKMLPKSAFAGSDKNKLGPAGQWKNTGPKKNKPAQAGDLVGGMEESLKDSNPCWKGYHPVGTKKKSGKTVPNCVPVSENVENIMDNLINKIIVNEAISNNKR